MSTIILKCTNCEKMFEREKADHQRRLAKLPQCDRFFCNLSCNAQYRNKHSENHNPPPPQYKNKHRQKYPHKIAWYVARCSKDSRFGLMKNDYRLIFANKILELWNKQEGKCSITKVSLFLRNNSGKCKTKDPFRIASLDRIDNTKSYTVDNVQWVSLAINLARGNLALNDFKKYYKNLSNFVRC